MAKKVCTKCHIEKDTSQFNKSKLGIFGLRGDCKDCQARYRKQHYSKNSEKARADRKASYRKDPEKERRYQRDYYSEHREDALEYAKEYRGKNSEKISKSFKKYYDKNAEQMRDKANKWRKDNPEKKRFYDALRNYLRKGAVGRHTQQEWEDLKKKHNYRCAYCGEKKPLTRDHVVALNRGGSNLISNILPACHSCNSSKQDKPLLEWLYQRLVG